MNERIVVMAFSISCWCLFIWFDEHPRCLRLSVKGSDYILIRTKLCSQQTLLALLSLILCQCGFQDLLAEILTKVIFKGAFTQMAVGGERAAASITPPPPAPCCCWELREVLALSWSFTMDVCLNS